MPELLEELAEETSTSNRRIAERLDAEFRRLTGLLEEQERSLAAVQQGLADRSGLCARSVESAEQATDHVVARMAEIEGIWKSLLNALKRNPLREDAEAMLSAALALFESGRVLLGRPSELWKFALALGAKSDRPGELAAAGQWLDGLIAEATAAREHRSGEWKPSDPERFAQGLQLAREGKTVKAEKPGRGSAATRGEGKGVYFVELLTPDDTIHAVTLLIDHHDQIASPAADVVSRAVVDAPAPPLGGGFLRDGYQRMDRVRSFCNRGLVRQGEGPCDGHHQTVLLHRFEANRGHDAVLPVGERLSQLKFNTAFVSPITAT
jgi:hypothetical protein